MVKYSETGKFTKKQIELAKRISTDLAALQKSGCSVLGKGSFLVAYKSKDYEHRAEWDVPSSHISLPYLECGGINDSGADDEEYFEKGYIDEDDDE